MLAQPSNIRQYNGGILESSPLLYQQHSISRSENLNVQPLNNPYNQYQQQQQQHYDPQPQQQAQYRSDDNPAPAAQNFLSTFFRDHHQYISPISSHTRPYFQVGEPFSTTPRTSPRLNAHRSVESSVGLIPKASSFDTAILGSGDFGVLRGGTFYQDNDPTQFRSSESSNEFSYYNKNGHGRPQAAAYVQKYTYPEDQFANFRDFADINTPNDPGAFSHFVVVYTNRNGTVVDNPNSSGEDEDVRKHEPRNILDQLRLLDEEKEATTSRIPKSKTKRKLKRTKLTRVYKKVQTPEKEEQEEVSEDRQRIDTDQIDPLLALS